jgi:hypothetical protein
METALGAPPQKDGGKVNYFSVPQASYFRKPKARRRRIIFGGLS